MPAGWERSSATSKVGKRETNCGIQNRSVNTKAMVQSSFLKSLDKTSIAVIEIWVVKGFNRNFLKAVSLQDD